jgi:hypothetical protein
MKSTVILYTKWNKGIQDDDPRLIIIATDKGLAAAGDPRTMAASQADSIVATFKAYSDDEYVAEIEEMIERAEGRAGGTGTGSASEVFPYSGKGKERADKIMADLLEARAKKVI